MEKEHEKLEAKSLSEFIKIVDSIQTRWTEKEDAYVYPWFRGHSQCTHKLIPGLYRNDKLAENENSYRHDFHQKAFPFLADSTYNVVPSSNWEWYFVMQHYGLPTRLLDWTEGSLIALYFALFYKNDNDESNPCVWAMNPFDFNRQLHNREEIFLFSDAKVRSYLHDIWSGESLPKKPLLFQPPHNSKRISAQKGCFIIFGSNTIPLEEIPELKDCLIKIEIKYYYIDLIKSELVMAGITESTLFPELSGLARELKEYWKLD
ncbi:FRG domain-containing protein [Ferruginibacter sp.]